VLGRGSRTPLDSAFDDELSACLDRQARQGRRGMGEANLSSDSTPHGGYKPRRLGHQRLIEKSAMKGAMA
jgi:hypothetical protein